MRIGVIGAGIAGLAVAAGLQRDGHQVVVYEQRAQPGAIGAGLSLFGNAFAALDELGLGDAVRATSSDAISGMRAGQRSPSGRWMVTLPREAVASLRSVHRVELHRVLLEALQPGTLRAGQTATVATDGAGFVAVDERQERFDLVVAADGIRSRSRLSLGLDPGVRYSGYAAWRGVTSGPVDIGDEAGETWGKGQRFGLVPLLDKRVYWFATLTTAPDTAFDNEHAEVRRRFAGWHAPIEACLADTLPDDVLRHDIYDLAEALPSFVKGSSVLLGDAAHAMTPDLGQGAGQAIEDAATLVLLLRRHLSAGNNRDGGVQAALSRYDVVRRRRTHTLWKRSRLMGGVAQLAHPLGAGLRDTALRLTPSRLLGRASRELQQWNAP
jgi:2-polyprenyl-6-methoxyphenol hydroxylase-like FAD-dependent oxidoreductase